MYITVRPHFGVKIFVRVAKCRHGLILFPKFLHVINNHPQSTVFWPYHLYVLPLSGPQFARMRLRRVLCLSFNDVHELNRAWEEKIKNIKKPA